MSRSKHSARKEHVGFIASLKNFIENGWIKELMPPDPTAESLDTNLSSEKAIEIIEQAGMKAHLYLPSVGHREDQSLALALDKLAHSGYIITDQHGNLVGKVATARPDSEEVAQHRRAQIKLVK